MGLFFFLVLFAVLQVGYEYPVPTQIPCNSDYLKLLIYEYVWANRVEQPIPLPLPIYTICYESVQYFTIILYLHSYNNKLYI